jgi:hypothetical protein
MVQREREKLAAVDDPRAQPNEPITFVRAAGIDTH